MKKNILITFLCGIVFFIGCGDSSTSSKKEEKINNITIENKKINVNSNGEVDYDDLRKKANVAGAADIIGYDGKAIKKDLNKIIDEREKMDKQLKDLDLK